MFFMFTKLPHFVVKNLHRKFYSSAATYCTKNLNFSKIKIGNVSKAISSPQNPHFVPIHYLLKETPLSNITISHLQWILKKDILGQDMFLIGIPGPLRRRIILQYLEMTQQELEYVTLTRDTTENDLKQRREIFDGNAYYVDQSAVRAALEGRFLILDGIEKVERNVLPVLNNLLENREMQLEDGRFLIAPERYDKLLSEHSQQELDKWKLVRVSEHFRVVALGLPVPHFKGNPLDPPFRSRFQARLVSPNFMEQIHELPKEKEYQSSERLKNFLSACYTFLSSESISLDMPKFPVENASLTLKLLDGTPQLPMEIIFRWLYPYSLFPKENQKSILKTLEQFSIIPKEVSMKYKIQDNPKNTVNNKSHLLEIDIDRKKSFLEISGHRNHKYSSNYIPNSYHESILSNLLLMHSVHDFCIIGNKGSGKSTLVKKFASLLNYPVDMVMLYNDMTARDLLQQRITDERGNTLWRPSQLIQAATDGKLLILDGLQRLHSSTISVLQRLVQNREMQLYDGTRVLRHDRYDVLKEKMKLSDEQMRNKKVIRVHPAFRIVALAEPPKTPSKKDNWLNAEVLSMFLFQDVRPLSFKEEKVVIQSIAKGFNDKMDAILKFAHKLRNSEDDALRNVSASFSTRQLVRMARRLDTFPEENVYNLIVQSCLMKFLPPLTKQAVENVLESCGLYKPSIECTEKKIQVTDEKLLIGKTVAPISQLASDKVKIPDILFYNSYEHVSVMEAMLQDFLLGEHLLLVGNQGVGKNKITDRFLQLLNRPREYVQLHRDTTVQSLTQQPTVIDGKIKYEDSPLLKAVQHGRILVVDEADKAPTHVTSILKALVVSGEMILSDGRRIVHHADVNGKNSFQVVMHPDFRMIVLANRPGFPFQGNDFFATLGDIFSCHAVDNPSLESEIAMLQQYGPNVSVDLLKKLAVMFGELRSMSDAGLISYPYSTREAVNVIKHLNKFPDEGMPFVLKNVFDFDSYSSDMKGTLNDLFKKHGIPFENQALKVKLFHKYTLPKPIFKAEWTVEDAGFWPSKMQDMRIINQTSLPVKEESLNTVELRANTFTELKSYCRLPVGHNDVPLGIASTTLKNYDITFVVSGNPITLFTLNHDKGLLNSINLSSCFPTVRSGYKPLLKISPVNIASEKFVLLHECSSNQTLLIDPLQGSVKKISLNSLLDEAISKISHVVSSNKQNLQLRTEFISQNKAVFYSNEPKFTLLDFETETIYDVECPIAISNINVLDEYALLIKSENGNYYVVDISNPRRLQTRKLFTNCNFGNNIIKIVREEKPLDTEPSENNINSNRSLMSNLEDYVHLISGSFLKDNTLSITSFPRERTLSEDQKSVIFPRGGQVTLVRFLQSHELPEHVKTESCRANSGYLEVVNVDEKTYGYIEIYLPHSISSLASWLANTSRQYILMCSSENGDINTVDAIGNVKKWEINRNSLDKSFAKWKAFVGLESKQQLSIEYVSKGKVSSPKFGKIDPTGAPHVGGNTWAGGTGGRDTAGLGGRGGPYRLDAGHDVFQISDAEKDDVPPEVKAAARQMGLRAYKEKLKEIEMSEYDANLYDQFYSSVEKQVKSLRVILEGLQAKSKDRQWLKHQTSGEFDDTKLIEGITGEKSIFKRRGEHEPEMGSPQDKPKCLRFVVDVSGSMYRFNGYDKRLERELESVVLVMEAFDKYNEKFQYEVIGHSGEEFCLEFSKFDQPPKNKKDRLDLIRKMHAHSQFCMSGDNTLEATGHAIRTITDHDADEYFVIVMSDANFDRYGISPASFGRLLNSNPKVNAFAIFIGSLGDQAEMLSKQLPAGRTFVCFDSSNLTQILQKIFTSALLKD